MFNCLSEFHICCVGSSSTLVIKPVNDTMNVLVFILRDTALLVATQERVPLTMQRY